VGWRCSLSQRCHTQEGKCKGAVTAKKFAAVLAFCGGLALLVVLFPLSRSQVKREELLSTAPSRIALGPSLPTVHWQLPADLATWCVKQTCDTRRVSKDQDSDLWLLPVFSAEALCPKICFLPAQNLWSSRQPDSTKEPDLSLGYCLSFLSCLQSVFC